LIHHNDVEENNKNKVVNIYVADSGSRKSLTSIILVRIGLHR
jgi:hypothetical protein